MITAGAEITGEAVASHYDELDRFYREIWGEHVHHGLWIRGNESPEQATEQLIERIAGSLQLRAGDRVCDVGCGYGGTCRFLAGNFGVEMDGITISGAQFEYARSRAGTNESRIHFHHLDWLQNRFAARTFDRLLAIESSEHMPDKQGFFSEAFRVLKPGGRIAVTAWLTAERSSAAERSFLLEPICREGRMPHMGRASEYCAMMRRAGFRGIRYEDLSRKVARTWAAILNRFGRALLRDPKYVRFLSNRNARNRVFALTLVRIWLAYKTGAMRYGIFSGTRPV